jgi:hypothetical protein
MLFGLSGWLGSPRLKSSPGGSVGAPELSQDQAVVETTPPRRLGLLTLLLGARTSSGSATGTGGPLVLAQDINSLACENKQSTSSIHTCHFRKTSVWLEVTSPTRRQSDQQPVITSVHPRKSPHHVDDDYTVKASTPRLRWSESELWSVIAAFLAAKNKCLAERNKSSDVGKATKKRVFRLVA